LAVAGLLAEQGWSVDWVGTERGIEQRLVPAAGLPLHHLSVSGLRGKNWVARVQGTLRLVAALWQSLTLMWRVKPDVVLGMGGYAAGPAGLAAWLTRRPLVIHEQNSVAGTTNRWLAPLARRVLCGLPGGFAADRKAEVVGNPVRQMLTPVDRGELNQLSAFSAARPLRVLVLGGSLGAAPLNALLPPVVNLLIDRGLGQSLSLWQQCGERNRVEADAAWIDSPFADRRCDDFIDDMPAAYAWADVVIALAGALTVSELAATGTAAILIPLPHAIDDHQTQNAWVLANAGAALLLPQSEATPERLAGLLTDWVASPLSLSQLSNAASELAAPDATHRVVEVLREAAHASG
jgi:UDP-N-acetylglucosamine--N-acetylmuramyl-(pentapeptide) pyrophosphoryl-undecaprenol N-acetylglucosamine transferase